MTARSPRSQTVRERLSRRQLLVGAGGLAVGLPVLTSLLGRDARAQGVTPPKRLVLMYTPNGVIPEAWWPVSPASETDFALNAIHQPLADFKSRLLLFTGVDLAITKTGPGGLHQRGIGGLFTGRELQEGTQFVDGCGQTAGWANGISVDQEVANHVGQSTLLKSLELGVRALDNDVQGRISYAGPGQPLPPMNDPAEVFDRLFSSMGPSSGPIDQLKAQRKSVLDTVQSQFSSLSPQLSADDRLRLDAHLELVRDAERRLTAGASPNGACTVPARPMPLIPSSETDMPLIADLELDLLALAFACDLTRVASYQISTSLNRIRYPWLESTGEGHSLSHTGPSDVASKDQLVRRQTWHAGRLAYFLKRLSEMPEADGSTVLDHTMVVWGNEVALGYTHSHTNMPFLIAGGGWHFRTGRALTYASASHSDLLVSILNAMGVAATTFGHPDFCTGPLSGLT